MKLIIGDKLIDELTELCKEYNVEFITVKDIITEYNQNYEDLEKVLIEEAIQIAENNLNLLNKVHSNKHQFENIIASLIFYKYKLLKI